MSAYAAAAAHHGCDHFLRAKYPLRWRLRNRLRYALEHDRQFALWRSAHGTWLAGVSGSEAQPLGISPPLETLSDIPPQQATALLVRLFTGSGGPLELTTIVDLAAAIWRVPLLAHDGATGLEQVVDRGRGSILRSQIGSARTRRGRKSVSSRCASVRRCYSI